MIIKIARWTMLAQGLYFTLTALFALANIRAFFVLTRYAADPFKTYANAVLFLALGVLLAASAYRGRGWRELLPIAAIASAGLAAVTYAYLPIIGNPVSFRLDLGVEAFCAVVYLAALARNRD